MYSFIPVLFLVSYDMLFDISCDVISDMSFWSYIYIKMVLLFIIFILSVLCYFNSIMIKVGVVYE